MDPYLEGFEWMAWWGWACAGMLVGVIGMAGAFAYAEVTRAAAPAPAKRPEKPVEPNHSRECLHYSSSGWHCSVNCDNRRLKMAIACKQNNLVEWTEDEDGNKRKAAPVLQLFKGGREDDDEDEDEDEDEDDENDGHDPDLAN